MHQVNLTVPLTITVRAVKSLSPASRLAEVGLDRGQSRITDKVKGGRAIRRPELPPTFSVVGAEVDRHVGSQVRSEECGGRMMIVIVATTAPVPVPVRPHGHLGDTGGPVHPKTLDDGGYHFR